MTQNNMRSSTDALIRTARRQGAFKGVFGTLLVLVVVTIGLLFMPQSHKHVTDTRPEIGQASFEVSISRRELNALVEKYINADPSLRKQFRFEMQKKGMMVYGTYKLFGQSVDFGMQMTPEVTKNGGILLHADSVAVGQLPLPVKFVMNYFGKKFDLPKWLVLDSQKRTLLIDLGKAPKVQGVRVKAVQIDPKNDKFVFRGGFSDR
ncbi:YpmS family protein [Weissella bombi]|uniref:Uncharacterized protein YpmS n=1 Tax=Weissella bombi TaxID=1505725 RepID=A0A1C3YP33_9LACO|nr:YpmS family protein [Weissella bombi]SCB71854.1 Uncharacterized protein YpmS [Weissella bombi]